MAPRLAEQSCTPQSRPDGVLTADTIQSHLQHLSGWAFHAATETQDASLQKTYMFENYYETMAFVNAVAYVAHREDHHPDLTVSYNRCHVFFSTHDVGGVSINDFICAAKLDAL